MPVPRAGSSEQTPTDEWVLEDFGTLNTKVERPAVGDNDFAWNENWMPLATGRIRTLYAEGANIYTIPGSATIVYKYSYVINGIAYWAVFLSDGTATQIQLSNGAQTSIGSGFYTLGQSSPPACAQWQSKYLLIISLNGYWAWNGSLLFGAGGLAPDVTITGGGKNYTSTPSVTAYGGTGSGATFSATVTANAVTTVTVTNPGSGYSVTDVVQLGFSGGGSDTTAVASATVNQNVSGVSALVVTNPGKSYSASTVPAISGGGASSQANAVVGSAVNGQITSLIVTNPGVGYTSVPGIDLSSGGGNNCFVTVKLTPGQVTAINATVGGTNYGGPPTVTITGDGSNAAATASVSGGSVTGFTVTNAGWGYTKATVYLTGGNNAASATVGLWPTGIVGTTIETYQGRVWIGNGVNLYASAPGTVANFATSAGGVITQITDSNLKTQITRLAQSTGFLYGFGDSSIFVITNVQTTSTGTTSYNISNVDPQVGTGWRDSVASLGRALVFANPAGVYALYGGAAEKVSEQLDGLFQDADFVTVTPTASIATIYNTRVYMLNFRTVDPYRLTTRTMMAMWNGTKWWMGSQLKTPIFIQTQEIASAITAYGTDGSHVFPMFQTPSTALSKTLQTKLRKAPTYTETKRALRMYFVALSNGLDIVTLTIGTDNDVSNGSLANHLLQTASLSFTGLSGVALTFTGVGGGLLSFYGAPQVNVDGFSTNNYGKLIGYTLTTSASDLDIISITTQFGEFSPFG